MTNAVLSLADVRFAYEKGETVLDVSAFALSAGERVFLRGPSGSGKSTLLGLIAGVLEAQAGEIVIDGETVSRLTAARRDSLRADKLGVIFQMFNLLPFLTVGGNVTLPCRFSQLRARAARTAGGVEAEGKRLLAALQLDADAVWSRPSRALSVGQQQRVAAARALIGKPRLILADEPTSALDADARDAFLDLLLAECDASGAALLFVSHDAGLADRFDRAEDLAALNRAGRETAP